MPSFQLPRLRFSLRSVVLLLTAFSAACGWLAWQRNIVQTRQGFAARLPLLDRPPDIAGRAFKGEPHTWSIELEHAGDTPGLIQHPPKSTKSFSPIRRWLGDEPYGLVVIRDESACPNVRDIFPEANILILHRDGASVEGRGQKTVWSIRKFDVKWESPVYP